MHFMFLFVKFEILFVNKLRPTLHNYTADSYVCMNNVYIYFSGYPVRIVPDFQGQLFLRELHLPKCVRCMLNETLTLFRCCEHRPKFQPFKNGMVGLFLKNTQELSHRQKSSYGNIRFGADFLSASIEEVVKVRNGVKGQIKHCIQALLLISPKIHIWNFRMCYYIRRTFKLILITKWFQGIQVGQAHGSRPSKSTGCTFVQRHLGMPHFRYHCNRHQ